VAKLIFAQATISNYSITAIIKAITDHTSQWKFDNASGCAWFRGQDREDPPLPSLFRAKYDEYQLNITFRNRATALKDVPNTDQLDKWLFLMQHYGVPTRLLDWTESLLLALFFALDSYNEKCSCKKARLNPTVWVLHPFKLNAQASISGFPNQSAINTDTQPAATQPQLPHFRLAFTPKEYWSQIANLEQATLPVAIHTNYLDLRILSQRSCFTIHGTREEDFGTIYHNTGLIKEGYLFKFVIPGKHAERLLEELNILGINKSSVYPDLQHLALELKKRFKL